MSRRLRSQPRGFTLVEAITAITIVSVIGLLSSFLLAESVDRYADSSVRGALHLELSVALDQVSRELRATPLDPSASSTVPDISNVSATSITFGDGGLLSLTGSELVLARSGESSATILTDVISLEIAAFDENNDTLAMPLSGGSCDPIRRLSITITAERMGLIESLRSRVFIRSMLMETSP